jgi:hypothetical protein
MSSLRSCLFSIGWVIVVAALLLVGCAVVFMVADYDTLEWRKGAWRHTTDSMPVTSILASSQGSEPTEGAIMCRARIA